MKPFSPSPPIQAFYAALVALAQQPATAVTGDPRTGMWLYALQGALPPVPPAPTDPVELAFFNDVCLDLYAKIGTALQASQQALQTALYGPTGVPVPAQNLATPP